MVAADSTPAPTGARLRAVPPLTPTVADFGPVAVSTTTPAAADTAAPTGSTAPTASTATSTASSATSSTASPATGAGAVPAPARVPTPLREGGDVRGARSPHASALLATDGGLLAICRLLWPDPAVVAVAGSGTAAPDGSATELYIAHRDGGRPKLLLPARPAAAAAALRRYSHGTTTRERLARQAAAVVVRVAGPGRVWRDRIRVEAAPGADTIEDYLREVYGQGVQVALSVGPPRANRKPVLQVLGGDGSTLGYVKVGWNQLTRRLVRAEVASLEAINGCDLQLLRVPSVVDHREWRDLELLATSPLPLPRWGDRHRGAVPVAAMAELATCPAGVVTGSWSDSSYAAGLTARVAATGSSEWLPALAEVAARLDSRAAGAELPFGSWHGDWTPRNMGWSGRQVSLWDWERFDLAVPLGFDVVHYLVHRALSAGRSGDAALAALCAEEAPTHLAALGLDDAQARLVVDAYLLEISMRYAADASGSSSDRLRRLSSQLLALLDARLGQR